MVNEAKLGKVASRFVKALHEAEQTKNAEPVANLFQSNANLERVGNHKQDQEDPSAVGFWSRYLEPFEEIESQFQYVTEVDDRIVLEWESKGKLKDGKPIRYAGVSVVDFDKKEDKFKSFRTYYDSAAFLTESAGHHSV